MGEAKGAAEVCVPSFPRKGKPAGGTEGGRLALLEMPGHPPSEDFKAGSWLHGLVEGKGVLEIHTESVTIQWEVQPEAG